MERPFVFGKAMKKALEDMELIDITPNGIYFADPVLETWYKRNC